MSDLHVVTLCLQNLLVIVTQLLHALHTLTADQMAHSAF